MLTLLWIIVAITVGGIADLWYYIDTPNRHRRAREAHNERLRLSAEASRYRHRRNAFLKRLWWRLTLRRGPALKPIDIAPDETWEVVKRDAAGRGIVYSVK